MGDARNPSIDHRNSAGSMGQLLPVARSSMPVKEDRRSNKASIGLSERWTAYEFPVLLEIRAAIR
ncbi:hypothetical protein CTS44_22017 [Comamonas thiooxydans]|nr:hypothetical protein CTS44_22017 [Comamonas thiooxydans]KKI15112.1 hypothetical protein XA67_04610 [Comamonas thiooxydans]